MNSLKPALKRARGSVNCTNDRHVLSPLRNRHLVMITRAVTPSIVHREVHINRVRVGKMNVVVYVDIYHDDCEADGDDDDDDDDD